MKHVYGSLAIGALSLVSLIPAKAQSAESAIWTLGESPSTSILLATQEKLHRNAIKQQSVEMVVPEFIIGGEWSSTLKLTNRGTANIPASQAYFIDNSGKPMSATFQITGGSVITDAGFSFFLGPGAIVETTFFGADVTRFGQILIDPNACLPDAACDLYGEVTLRNRNSTRPDFESVFPLEQPANVQYMLFDHRNGAAMVLYLVSVSTATGIVNLEFRNTSNQLIRTVSISLPSAAAQIVNLPTVAPETVGLNGTLTIRGQATTTFVVATALRINPSNSFTPVRAFVPK